MKVLAAKFRGKLLSTPQQHHGDPRFGETLASLADPARFVRWLSPPYDKAWVVYSQHPFGGRQQVLK